MRTTPLWHFPSFLSEADKMIRHHLEILINISLSDFNWIQASLPIKHGGLGIRKLNDICLPAFLASAHGVCDQIKSFFPSLSDSVQIPICARGFGSVE